VVGGMLLAGLAFILFGPAWCSQGTSCGGPVGGKQVCTTGPEYCHTVTVWPLNFIWFGLFLVWAAASVFMATAIGRSWKRRRLSTAVGLTTG
jgi:hypothetical protein